MNKISKKLLMDYFPRTYWFMTPDFLMAEYKILKHGIALEPWSLFNRENLRKLTKMSMVCEINNKRRFKGKKPLRRRTWKRLNKGS